MLGEKSLTLRDVDRKIDAAAERDDVDRAQRRRGLGLSDDPDEAGSDDEHETLHNSPPAGCSSSVARSAGDRECGRCPAA